MFGKDIAVRCEQRSIFHNFAAKIVELGAEIFTLCEKFTVYNYSCYTYGVAPAGKML